jgi:hypothetical protein
MKKMLAVVVIAVVTACGSTELVVESNTSWYGYVQGLNSGPTWPSGYRNGMRVSGSGDRRFELDSRTTCWKILLSAPGRLKVYALKKSLTGSERVGEDEVTVLEWHTEGHVRGCL